MLRFGIAYKQRMLMYQLRYVSNAGCTQLLLADANTMCFKWVKGRSKTVLISQQGPIVGRPRQPTLLHHTLDVQVSGSLPSAR